jgi:hypothetical protein
METMVFNGAATSSERQAERSGEKRARCAFRQQLPQQPPSARAECEAHGNFFAAGNSARERSLRQGLNLFFEVLPSLFSELAV